MLLLPKYQEMFSTRAHVRYQTAILCVYEFLSATGAAWSRHLSGATSLLCIAKVGMMALGELALPRSQATLGERLSGRLPVKTILQHVSLLS